MLVTTQLIEKVKMPPSIILKEIFTQQEQDFSNNIVTNVAKKVLLTTDDILIDLAESLIRSSTEPQERCSKGCTETQKQA